MIYKDNSYPATTYESAVANSNSIPEWQKLRPKRQIPKSTPTKRQLTAIEQDVVNGDKTRLIDNTPPPNMQVNTNGTMTVKTGNKDVSGSIDLDTATLKKALDGDTKYISKGEAPYSIQDAIRAKLEYNRDLGTRDGINGNINGKVDAGMGRQSNVEISGKVRGGYKGSGLEAELSRKQIDDIGQAIVTKGLRGNINIGKGVSVNGSRVDTDLPYGAKESSTSRGIQYKNGGFTAGYKQDSNKFQDGNYKESGKKSTASLEYILDRNKQLFAEKVMEEGQNTKYKTGFRIQY